MLTADTPSFLIGAFYQYDEMRQTSQSQSSDAHGTGWMAGPYATLKLSENIFWQSRAAWGQANNAISPAKTYIDKFDSDRRLVASTLTGRWDFGAWSFQPAVSVSYIEETANGYTDSQGIAIPQTTNRLGQGKAGPVFSYRYEGASGLTIEPRLGLQVVWDFASETRAAGLGPIDGDKAGVGLRGRTELGVSAVTASGVSLDLSGSYDGIGSASYSAISGNAALRVPLQ